MSTIMTASFPGERNTGFPASSQTRYSSLAMRINSRADAENVALAASTPTAQAAAAKRGKRTSFMC